jgi:hypothetical protein
MEFNEILFFVMSCIGMVSHYFKKYAKNETTVTIWEWFGASNLPGSVASIGSLLFAVSSAIASGTITPEMSMWSVIFIGMTTGIAIDSTTNSDGSQAEK